MRCHRSNNMIGCHRIIFSPKRRFSIAPHASHNWSYAAKVAARRRASREELAALAHGLRDPEGRHTDRLRP